MTISATVADGRLEIVVPPDWPDGTEVEIRRREEATNRAAAEMSAKEIAETLAAMDRIEPLEWSDEERAAWEAEQQARRNREKADFAEHSEALRRQWE